METLRTAAQEYINQQSRISHPNGNTDNGGRWYPKEDERCECCNHIRQPSRAYPWSLMTHCRTIRHIANLYNVKESDLRKEVKSLRN